MRDYNFSTGEAEDGEFKISLGLYSKVPISEKNTCIYTYIVYIHIYTYTYILGPGDAKFVTPSTTEA